MNALELLRLTVVANTQPDIGAELCVHQPHGFSFVWLYDDLLRKLTEKKEFKLLDIVLLSPRKKDTTVGTVTGYNDLTIFNDYTTNKKWKLQDIRVLQGR